MRKGTTLYSKKSGVEVITITREKVEGKAERKYRTKYGAIRMRFFEKKRGGKRVRVILSPKEVHKLSRIIKGIVKQKQPVRVRALYHEYKNHTSIIFVEYWKSKDGKKEGYALLLQRENGNGDKVEINVPVSVDEFIYLADFLHHLALEQSWFTTEVVEEEGTEKAPPVPPPEEEEVSDPDEVHPEIDEVDEVGDDIGDIDF